MKNLLSRILVGLIGIPFAVGIVWQGGYVFEISIVVFTTLALWEYYRLARAKEARPNAQLGLIGSIVLQATMVATIHNQGYSALYWGSMLPLMIVGGALLTLTLELWRGRPNAILNTALTITGVAYVTLCMSALIFLREMDGLMFESSFGSDGAALVLTMFISIWMCDSAAYFIGVRFGKHKLFPRVSPKKSWEGAIAGGLVAIMAFVGMSFWLMPQFEIRHAFVGGIIVATIGQVGDLAESLLKRDVGVKDSSNLLAGHGGILDRFDSLLFVAPSLFLYLSWVLMT